MDAERAERVKGLLRKEIDWGYVLRTSASHGVLPLLYRSLSSTCPEAVPKGTMRQLRDYSHANALRNLFLTRELLKILSDFDAHRITAVPFKGPLLAESVYGDVSLRQFYDLDILVPRQHLQRAKEILLSQGYMPEFALTPRQEASYVKCRHHCRLLDTHGRTFVELHWRVTDPYLHFSVDRRQLWSRLQPMTLSGTQVMALSREDLFLILCAHGTKHFWARLEWMCDVAELIAVHKGINWQRVMDRARRLGGQRMLFLGLFLASDLLGAALPEEVLRTVRADPIVKSVGRQVCQQLFQSPNFSTEIRERFLFYLKMADGISHQLRYSLRCALRVVIPTRAEWELLPLPDSLFFLYYLVRPIRLAAKYGPSMLRRFL